MESNDDRFDSADRTSALSLEQFESILTKAFSYCNVGRLKQKAKVGISGGGKTFLLDEYERGFIQKVVIDDTHVLAATIFPVRTMSGKVTKGLQCNASQPCSIGIDGKTYFVPRDHGKIKRSGIVTVSVAGPE